MSLEWGWFQTKNLPSAQEKQRLSFTTYTRQHILKYWQLSLFFGRFENAMNRVLTVFELKPPAGTSALDLTWKKNYVHKICVILKWGGELDKFFCVSAYMSVPKHLVLAWLCRSGASFIMLTKRKSYVFEKF